MSATVVDAPEGLVHRNEVAAPAPSPPTAWCEECGYDLRGLSTGRPCPECGHVHASPRPVLRPDLLWNRSVAVGLALLLGVTVYATSSVLVQPFSGDFGGTLPALNVPGPKLWAVPLLQRPIGQNPQWPGVVGTRTALFSLLAVWLITAPRTEPEEGTGADSALGWVRPAARWASVVLFGLAFGVLLASQGIWPAELPPYRLVLVGAVELPAAGLLYAHLHALARRVPGRQRRRVFELLRWLVPAAILGGVAMIATDWLLGGGDQGPGRGARLVVSAVYGAVVVTCGMAATAAVASLGLSYSAAAFPDAWRVVSGSRRLARAAWHSAGSAHNLSLRFAAVAVGLVLFVTLPVFGNDLILWYTSRQGVGGNLPFFNFPGPKLWAAAIVPELGGRYYWDPIVSRTALGAMNLAAIWLMTLQLDGRESHLLRRLTRWLPVVMVGFALGLAAASRTMDRSDRVGADLRSEFFALTMVLCELPATVLIYLYLSTLASTYTRRLALKRNLVAAGFAIPALVGTSLVAFLLSKDFRAARAAPAVLALCGAYGALALAAAVWTGMLVLALAGALVRGHVLQRPHPARRKPLFLSIAPAAPV